MKRKKRPTLKWMARTLVVMGCFAGLNGVLFLVNYPDTLAVYLGVFGLVLGGLMARKAWRVASLLSLVVVSGALSGCTVIEPGHAGIKVHMTGSDKGVDQLPVVTGRIFYNPWVTDVYEYPTFMQVAKWEKEEALTFNSKEGMQIGASISLGYQIEASKVPAFYVQFRNDDLDGFTHGYLRNVARDAFNEEAVKYTVEEIYGEKKEALFIGVRDRINGHVASYGVKISQFGAIGALDLPQNIVQSLNLKIKATQDAITIENQLRASKAEAEKSVAQAEGAARVQVAQAEGEAKARLLDAESKNKANQLLQQNITPGLLEWRRLEIQALQAQKWNGALPTSMVPGTAVPFVQIPQGR